MLGAPVIYRDPDQTSGFFGISLSCFGWLRVFWCLWLFSVQSMAWQLTFNVISAWHFIRPLRKTGGKNLHALVTQNMVSFSEPSESNAKHEIYRAFQDRLTFLNRHMIVWLGWDPWISQIYWKCRTANYLVFWKPWPAVDLKKYQRKNSKGWQAAHLHRRESFGNFLHIAWFFS